MSEDCMEDVFIKEEYVIQETNLSDYNQLLPTSDPPLKCGEIFLGHQGTFTFVCSQCLHSFLDLCSFGEHIRDFHTPPTDESLANDYKTPLKLESLDPDDPDLHNKEEEEELHDVHDSIDMSNDSKYKSKVQSKQEFFKATVERTKRQKRTETYCCYTCGRVIVGFEMYRKHYRDEHPDMIKKDDTDIYNQQAFVPKIPEEMVCKYCLSTFDEPTDYHKHMEFGHPRPKRYSCPQCPRIFVSKNNRDYHHDLHEGKKRFQCPHCPKAFTHPNNLQAHINIHLNIKPFSCKFCSQKYIQKSALLIHERIHTKERPFKCEECDMSFIAQVKLTNHKRTHKNIRNYPCPYCDKAFYSGRDLSKHKRTHSKETSYSCDICDEKFSAKVVLERHKLLHTGEKKYECKLCEKTFAQYPGLYSHMKSHGEVTNLVVLNDNC